MPTIWQPSRGQFFFKIKNKNNIVSILDLMKAFFSIDVKIWNKTLFFFLDFDLCIFWK
jgi:hypothetical protein